jgi:hypothetical protein
MSFDVAVVGAIGDCIGRASATAERLIRQLAARAS